MTEQYHTGNMKVVKKEVSNTRAELSLKLHVLLTKLIKEEDKGKRAWMVLKAMSYLEEME